MVRHRLRLGATANQADIRGGVTYLYNASAAVIQAALTVESAQAERLSQLNQAIWLAQLESIMGD